MGKTTPRGGCMPLLGRSFPIVDSVLVVTELVIPVRTVAERLVLRTTAPAECEMLR